MCISMLYIMGCLHFLYGLPTFKHVTLKGEINNTSMQLTELENYLTNILNRDVEQWFLSINFVYV